MRRMRDLYENAPSGAHRHLDTITVALGLLIGFAGIFSVIYAFRAGAIVLVIGGCSLLIAGLVEVAEAVVHRGEREPTRGLLSGILHGVVGAMILWRPESTLLTLTLLLGVMFFAGGLGRVFTAFATRHPAWGWAVASGLLSVLLGIYVVGTWPLSSFWLIGTLVGIELMGTSMALLATGFTLNRIERHFDRTAGSHP